MSIWYDKEGKSYTAYGTSAWLRKHLEHLLETFRKETEARFSGHFSGREGRHSAQDVDYSREMTVQAAIDGEIALREEGQQALQEALSQKASLEYVNQKLDPLPAENEVLTKANTVVYTPTDAYHPATKKYVDDCVDGRTVKVSSQAEWDAMIAKPDWGGVESVYLDTAVTTDNSKSLQIPEGVRAVAGTGRTPCAIGTGTIEGHGGCEIAHISAGALHHFGSVTDCIADTCYQCAYVCDSDVKTVSECGKVGLTGKTVLTKYNTLEYEPTEDYNPATKKYVDDATTPLKDNTAKIHGMQGGLAGGLRASVWTGTTGDAGGAAVGRDALAANGFAGGMNAKTAVKESGPSGEILSPIDAVQLGTGTNPNPKTLQVYNYQLLDANGKIPAERLPAGTGGGGDTPGKTPLYVKHKGMIDFGDSYNNTWLEELNSQISTLDTLSPGASGMYIYDLYFLKAGCVPKYAKLYCYSEDPRYEYQRLVIEGEEEHGTVHFRSTTDVGVWSEWK